MRTIDRKFIFTGINPCNKRVYSEQNAVLFAAKDAVFLEYALPAYLQGCKEKGCGPEHIESIEMLIERVRDFQRESGGRVPDTETDCEIDRCIGGKL